MNIVKIYAIFGLLLLLILPGFCAPEEGPGFVAYIQGGNASIMEDENGSLVFTVHDIIPFFYLTSEKMSVLIPIEGLSGLSYPMNAAVLFSGSDTDSEGFVVISNLSLAGENTIFTAHVTPHEFYEGDVVKTRIRNQSPLSFSNRERYQDCRIYLEVPLIPPQNSQSMSDDYGYCIVQCYLNGGVRPCELTCQKFNPN